MTHWSAKAKKLGKPEEPLQFNVETLNPVLQDLIAQKANDLAGLPSGLAKSDLTPPPGMILVANSAGDGAVWHEPPVAKPISFTEFLNQLAGQKLYLGAVSVSTDYAPGQVKRATVTFELDTHNKEGKAALLEIIEWAHKNTH